MRAKEKILVVEDNLINRTMLTDILSGQYETIEAENGKEALERLEEHKDELALILLDIVMPVMDGYTFLSAMKKKPEYASIPVIVTTQNDADSDEVAALMHGATDYVVKPYNPQVILHRVASILHLRETAAIVNLLQHDRLTGTYSKEYFYQCARKILQENPEKEYDFICSDIENFKLINEVFGDRIGDQLLRRTAEVLREKVRGRGIFAHFHADQFVCMVEHGRTYVNEDFLRVSDEVNRTVKAGKVVMKWGIYVTGERTVSVERMCDWALQTARSIKGKYGKIFAYYVDELHKRMVWDQAVSNCMEKALAKGQFQVWFQPKYNLRSDQFEDVEALVRWQHPEWGLLSPAAFIPLFEKNGFITKLDRFVWERACEMMCLWDEQGWRTLNVSVNVSRVDLSNRNLSRELGQLADQYGLAHNRLHLEITESVFTENTEQIIEAVDLFRQNGFVVEMDDFGSGYSSLCMLSQMPVDILKLDMKFIQSEMAKPEKKEILQYIVELAHWLELKVVAEGVETEEQKKRLKKLGCDYIQGYYMAKPMSTDDFQKCLKKEMLYTPQKIG